MCSYNFRALKNSDMFTNKFMKAQSLVVLLGKGFPNVSQHYVKALNS